MPKSVAAKPVAFETLEGRTLFAFGLTTTTSSYVVDTGAGTVFTILRGGTISSTVHLGDMTSVKYNGIELLAPYSSTARYSHYEQGLTSTAIVSATVDPAGQWIKITCDDSAAATGSVIQYYVAKKGENNIYMASLPTDVNNGPGEGRYIAYMNRSVFTNIEDPSDISTTDASVEGSDVYYNTTTGITKSKFYNTRRMIDNTVHGITGTAVGAYMNMGNRERSSGGPFFKDIDFQTTSAATEMYNCLFTGHEQTEAYRQGLQGPYAMQITNGSAPVAPNYSFLEGVGILGLIPAAQRGAITGVASGVTVAGHQTVVTLANTSAQYWAYADSSTGKYTITGVLPGTYTETIYDNELAVGTKTVTISVGKPDQSNIVDTRYDPAAIFRIGTWDGTPKEFLNADKINIMHPSDSRMAPFTDVNYIVGTTADSAFPLAEFKDVNNDQKITFTLTAAQASQANTFRIGITSAFAGGRPQIVVNTGQTYAWTSALPSPTTQPDSRNITRGTWRGNNFTFTYAIPTSALKAGTNTIDISTNSGSTGSTPWLSPNIVFDALDLVPTASLTNAPVVKRVAVAPATKTLAGGATQTFTAIAYDQSNNVIAANFNWSAVSGLIDDNGDYIAPATSGTDTVTATSTVGGTAAVTIDATPPTLNSAVSRKVHGSAGTFDLPINLTATGTAATIEPRIGGGNTLVFTFSEPVQAVDGTLSANEFSIQNGTFGSASISGNTLTLNLSSVVDQKVLTVTLNGLSDAVGNALSGDNNVSVGDLYGDVNQSGTVTAADQQVIKNNLFLTLDATNFLADLNLSGSLTAADQQLAKNKIFDFLS